MSFAHTLGSVLSRTGPFGLPSVAPPYDSGPFGLRSTAPQRGVPSGGVLGNQNMQLSTMENMFFGANTSTVHAYMFIKKNGDVPHEDPLQYQVIFGERETFFKHISQSTYTPATLSKLNRILRDDVIHKRYQFKTLGDIRKKYNLLGVVDVHKPRTDEERGTPLAKGIVNVVINKRARCINYWARNRYGNRMPITEQDQTLWFLIKKIPIDEAAYARYHRLRRLKEERDHSQNGSNSKRRRGTQGNSIFFGNNYSSSSDDDEPKGGKSGRGGTFRRNQGERKKDTDAREKATRPRREEYEAKMAKGPRRNVFTGPPLRNIMYGHKNMKELEEFDEALRALADHKDVNDEESLQAWLDEDNSPQKLVRRRLLRVAKTNPKEHKNKDGSFNVASWQRFHRQIINSQNEFENAKTTVKSAEQLEEYLKTAENMRAEFKHYTKNFEKNNWDTFQTLITTSENAETQQEAARQFYAAIEKVRNVSGLRDFLLGAKELENELHTRAKAINEKVRLLGVTDMDMYNVFLDLIKKEEADNEKTAEEEKTADEDGDASDADSDVDSFTTVIADPARKRGTATPAPATTRLARSTGVPLSAPSPLFATTSASAPKKHGRALGDEIDPEEDDHDGDSFKNIEMCWAIVPYVTEGRESPPIEEYQSILEEWVGMPLWFGSSSWIHNGANQSCGDQGDAWVNKFTFPKQAGDGFDHISHLQHIDLFMHA